MGCSENTHNRVLSRIWSLAGRRVCSYLEMLLCELGERILVNVFGDCGRSVAVFDDVPSKRLHRATNQLPTCGEEVKRKLHS